MLASTQSWDTLSLTFTDLGQVPSEPVSSPVTSHMSATHKFKVMPEPRPGAQEQGTGDVSHRRQKNHGCQQKVHKVGISGPNLDAQC